LGEELAAAENQPDLPSFHVGSKGRRGTSIRYWRDEVYRIAGEAMRNAFKHAQAQRIEVEIPV